MPSNLFKIGAKVNLTVGNVSFKGVVEECEENNLVKIKVPSQWRNIVLSLDYETECIMTYKPKIGNYQKRKMIVVNKQTDSAFPMILLKPIQIMDKQNELRKEKRIEIFVFTEVSTKGLGKMDMYASGPHTAAIIDISLGGCLLMSNSNYNMNDCLWMIFGLSDETLKPLSVKCQVKSQRQAPMENSMYYGLEFINLGPVENEIIQSFVETSR